MEHVGRAETGSCRAPATTSRPGRRRGTASAARRRHLPPLRITLRVTPLQGTSQIATSQRRRVLIRLSRPYSARTKSELAACKALRGGFAKKGRQTDISSAGIEKNPDRRVAFRKARRCGFSTGVENGAHRPGLLDGAQVGSPSSERPSRTRTAPAGAISTQIRHYPPAMCRGQIVAGGSRFQPCRRFQRTTPLRLGDDETARRRR